MELNTPNKNQPISSTPLSHVEESPVFNYINNLSPIELVKSVRTSSTDQTFNSLSFSSPPSVFASPKLTSLRDTRSSSFLKRRQFSETLKPELPQSQSNKHGNNDNNNTSEGALDSEAVELDNNSNSSSSAKEITTGEQQLLNEHSDLPIELLPNIASQNNDAIRTHSHTENSNERHPLYDCEKHLRKICRIEQREDESGGDWVALISNVADMLNFDSSVTEEQVEEEQKIVDPGTISFISDVLQIPQDNNKNNDGDDDDDDDDDDMDNMEFSDGVTPSELKIKESGTLSKELMNNREADKVPPAVLSCNLQNKLVVNDAAIEVGIKGKSANPAASRIE